MSIKNNNICIRKKFRNGSLNTIKNLLNYRNNANNNYEFKNSLELQILLFKIPLKLTNLFNNEREKSTKRHCNSLKIK